MLSCTQTKLADCFILQFPIHFDVRGRFAKPFHAPTLASEGFCDHFEEDFYSVSKQGVLRGFHVMGPPFQGAKLVYVIQGHILDVILDLRINSPTFEQHDVFELNAEKGEAIYIAPGVAHAFLCLSETAIVGYKTERRYDPRSDLGIRWDSAGVEWPISDPLLSERDACSPTLRHFKNPFA